MAGTTPRFGLNFFGGDTPGDLDDDAQKYTSEDRLTIDAVLAALEQHNHRLVTHVGEPVAEPAAALEPDVEGTLAGSTTYYYVVSFINADGLETISGPETSVDTPAALDTPPAPQANSDDVPGGVLSAGLYFYAVTALRDDEESALSDPVSVTLVQDVDNAALITLPELAGADSFQIWRMGDEDPGYTRVGTSADPTWTDTGSVPAGLYGDPANAVPEEGTGQDNYAISITLTGADLDTVQTAAAWRIYRTETSGTYAADSLVHEVVERDDNDPDTTDPALLTSWTDDGDAAVTGSPQVISTQLSIPPFTFESVPSGSPLPDAGAYPDNYPIVDGDGVLYIARAGAWSAISGGSGTGGGSGGGTGGGSGSASPPPVWSSSTAYNRGDVVLTNIGYWVCLVANTGVLPDYDDAQDGTLNWRLLGARYAFHIDLNSDLDYQATQGYARGSVARFGNGLYVQGVDATVTGASPATSPAWTLLNWVVPAGGSTGQVLAKSSATDGDYAWTTPAAGGGGSSAPTVSVVSRGIGQSFSLTTAANQSVIIIGSDVNSHNTYATIDGQAMNKLGYVALPDGSVSMSVWLATPGAGSHNFGIGNGDSFTNPYGLGYVLSAIPTTVNRQNVTLNTGSDDPTLANTLGTGTFALVTGYVPTLTSNVALTSITASDASLDTANTQRGKRGDAALISTSATGFGQTFTLARGDHDYAKSILWAIDLSF